jgi:hypothetical protein
MLGWMEATIRANQEKMEAGQEQMTTEPRWNLAKNKCKLR